MKNFRIHATLGLVAALLLAACSDKDGAQPSQGEPGQGQPDYLDTRLPIDARVEDLVSRMTLSEKISQLYNEAPAIERLGVPEYNWWNEALHGVARAGKATVFPQAIGLAASFNKPLMHETATAISDEARAKHHYFVDNNVVFRYTGLTFWSPNVNIFRDPRWGRGQETYGEDPYLTGTLAVEFIKGMQGDDPDYLKTSAMAKHYAVHSGPEKSRHSDDYQATPEDLYETYLPAFDMAVNKADVESIMCAYNRVNGLPACGSDHLLKDILRDDWHFDGHVVSDCGALADFYVESHHHVVRAPTQAAAMALKAGTDLNCGTGRLSTYANLHFALQRGMVSMEDIDTAVKRLFKTRFKLGMFDPPEEVPYTNIDMSVVGSDEHRRLNQKMAEQSMVLLKNNGILPLDKEQRVAVIGPNATNPAILVANYHGDPIEPVLPLEGIRNYLGEDQVIHAPGSPLIGEEYGHYQTLPESVLFHRTGQGLEPGLNGAYYQADKQNGMAEAPAFKRVDSTVEFHWQKSPLDGETVRDEFGVVWSGVLKPEETGTYRFNSRAEIRINGEAVEGAVTLAADREYNFEAGTLFLREWWGHPLEPRVAIQWVNTSRDLEAEALAAAGQADLVLFMGGISAELEGEEMDVALEGFDHGDRTEIDLPDEQQALLKKLEATGKPVVLVNFSGSAMALNWEDENLDAIVQAFYPGETTGTALARLLWGEVSPSGRLPVTFYKGLDDLPGFKNYAMAGRTYKYYRGKPLYPFGHGLSYSDFHYTKLQAPRQIDAGEPVPLEVTLTNEGPMKAGEVTQVYVRMPNAPVAVPDRELVAYTRSYLAVGERRELSLTIDPEQLRYVDEQGRHQAYRGRLEVSIGSGQPGYTPEKRLQQTGIEIR